MHLVNTPSYIPTIYVLVTNPLYFNSHLHFHLIVPLLSLFFSLHILCSFFAFTANIYVLYLSIGYMILFAMFIKRHVILSIHMILEWCM